MDYIYQDRYSGRNAREETGKYVKEIEVVVRSPKSGKYVQELKYVVMNTQTEPVPRTLTVFNSRQSL